VTPAGEQRKYDRMPVDMRFEYSVTILDYKNLRKVSSSGIGVDVCDAGMGFLTDYPLEPGHVVKIDRSGISPRPFMVKWVRELFGKYRVGGIFL